MSIEINDFLHPQIMTNCQRLFNDGYYESAARNAMVLVERSLHEKSGIRNIFGTALVNKLFGNGAGIKLQVPFGSERQNDAAALINGAFRYYRNYVAHDGKMVDNRICLRILIIASELLELVMASDVSFASIGGINGLIEERVFADREEIIRLLSFLDGNTLPDEVIDGFYEDLYTCGFEDKQVDALIDVGLVEYIVDGYIATEPLYERGNSPSKLGHFELTLLGREILEISGTV